MLKVYGRYSQAYKKASVSTQDQRKLIIMLYDGAIRFLRAAAENISRGEQYGAHKNLIRGKSIIAELLASLNVDEGSEIARNLQRLYTYMFNELIEANLHKDAKRITQVVALLKDLREGWRGIGTSEPEAEPPRTDGSGNRRVKSINVRG